HGQHPAPRRGRPARVRHRRASVRVFPRAHRARPGARPARPAPAALLPAGADLGIPPLRRPRLPPALRPMPRLRRGARAGRRLRPRPQPAPLPAPQRRRHDARGAHAPHRRATGPVPALPEGPPPRWRHGRSWRGRVRAVPGRGLVGRTLPRVPRRRAPAGGRRDRPRRTRALGRLHLLRPGPGRARAGHVRDPAADRLGARRRPGPPVPGLLDRGAPQDGLQAPLPPAGNLHRPRLAATGARGGCMKPIVSLCLLLLACAGCVRMHVHGDPEAYVARLEQADAVRIAAYNASLYDDAAGGLVRRLESGDDRARRIAAVLQRVRPDIVLLGEFDFDPAHRAADLFQRDYLGRAQPGGGEPLRYRYRYLAPVNTGVPSGLDLDGNGSAGGEGRDRGNDAWGYGLHPGQYGMLVLSRYPIDAGAVRTFQLLKWSAMPGAARPLDPGTGAPHYPDAIWTQLRLSSKSHWDVPVATPAGTVHLLASHPTPPVFDGPEDRNGAR